MSSCRNLPYLKRDCDSNLISFFANILWQLSKPALLKKGLRLKLIKLVLHTSTSLSKPALLKKGLRLKLIKLVLHTSTSLSKPALLKKGLRRQNADIPNPTWLISRRNLPYLKRDCDGVGAPLSFILHLISRNLPYLKRDCDKKSSSGSSSPNSFTVETCPT